MFSELLLAAPVARGGWLDDDDGDMDPVTGLDVVLSLWMAVAVGEMSGSEDVIEAVA